MGSKLSGVGVGIRTTFRFEWTPRPARTVDTIPTKTVLACYNIVWLCCFFSRFLWFVFLSKTPGRCAEISRGFSGRTRVHCRRAVCKLRRTRALTAEKRDRRKPFVSRLIHDFGGSPNVLGRPPVRPHGIPRRGSRSRTRIIIRPSRSPYAQTTVITGSAVITLFRGSVGRGETRTDQPPYDLSTAAAAAACTQTRRRLERKNTPCAYYYCIIIPVYVVPARSIPLLRGRQNN